MTRIKSIDYILAHLGGAEANPLSSLSVSLLLYTTLSVLYYYSYPIGQRAPAAFEQDIKRRRRRQPVYRFNIYCSDAQLYYNMRSCGALIIISVFVLYIYN